MYLSRCGSSTLCWILQQPSLAAPGRPTGISGGRRPPEMPCMGPLTRWLVWGHQKCIYMYLSRCGSSTLCWILQQPSLAAPGRPTGISGGRRPPEMPCMGPLTRWLVWGHQKCIYMYLSRCGSSTLCWILQQPSLAAPGRPRYRFLVQFDGKGRQGRSPCLLP